MHRVIGLITEAFIDEHELDYVAQLELERVNARTILVWIWTGRRSIQVIAHLALGHLIPLEQRRRVGHHKRDVVYLRRVNTRTAIFVHPTQRIVLFVVVFRIIYLIELHAKVESFHLIVGDIYFAIEIASERGVLASQRVNIHELVAVVAVHVLIPWI